MNLQQRLERAREQRRASLGLPALDERPAPAEARSAPADTLDRPASGAAVDVTRDEPAVDLTAPVIDLTTRIDWSARPAPFTPAADDQAGWSGATTYERRDDCPSCGGPVRLDLEDVVGHVDHMSCERCGLLFQIAR